MQEPKTIAILGINGHLGRQVAFAAKRAGLRVIGFGRTQKQPIEGVEFVSGDANSVEDMKRATREADVVLNSLNLPYDKWGNGAAEALSARVVEACKGKTLLFPGNIYNYRATDRVLTPDLRQDPETERGAIRVRMEQHLEQAAKRGELQVVILRAGNFYGSDLPGDWFGQLIFREASKGRVALNPARKVRNAWAYLPDLARAFVVLALRKGELSAFENFHFHGHLVTADETFQAIQKAVPQKLVRVDYPWRMLKVMGWFMPTIRGLVQMRYVWEYELGLVDPRLEKMLGPDFDTPFDQAIASVSSRYFPAEGTGSAKWAA